MSSSSSDTECLTSSDYGSESDDTLPVVKRYPVRLLNKGSINQPILYDVLGRPLHNSFGGYHNLFSAETREAMRRKELRCIHVVYPGYRYWVKNNYDREVFRTEKEVGSRFRGVVFHVYYDEDMDLDYQTHYTRLSRSQ